MNKNDPTINALGRVVGSLCILTAQKGNEENTISGAMVASWVSQASFNPPGITIAVAKERAVENLLHTGDYFALKGTLSPLEGLGPEEIGIIRLQTRLEKENIKELILATSTTIEGEATAHYIQKICQDLNIKVSRIAFGIPLNGELGYLDGETISHAFNERKEL